ncbi:GlxA family transcriptional regulator [Kitasatospora kifunensis]|uniref:Transcriptional regulator GlxA family with amidase domain n=1 Tax=Kitasatospora kifunensis TaxID=58351 RepID=A0A7W7R8K7_KITKI|nr:helix-turn-helix domain-containing protein [Kitasatospora kifunensis]MBB4927289.1 transcriptional regulator GlxA family with amidase domain [Kitasatospora kifunensis]
MHISVLVLDGVFDSGLASVLDVFETANELRGELPQPPPPWQVTCVSPVDGPNQSGGGSVRTAAGHAVAVRRPAEADPPELLIVPGVAHKQPAPLVHWLDAPERNAARELLARTHADGVPLAAACTGTFLLADAGVLNGLAATTSWWLAPLFRQRYPQVALDEERMLTRAAGITTAGAAMAHLDLALALVRDRSPVLADLAARYLVVDSRPTQASYAIPEHLARTDPTVAAFERWVREHLDQPLRIADAARALATSERTLQRALDRVLGISPLRFAQRIRLEQAAHLLRTTSLPTEAIARRVGYENASTLTTLLRERLGTTPGRLRRETGL